MMQGSRWWVRWRNAAGDAVGIFRSLAIRPPAWRTGRTRPSRLPLMGGRAAEIGCGPTTRHEWAGCAARGRGAPLFRRDSIGRLVGGPSPGISEKGDPTARGFDPGKLAEEEGFEPPVRLPPRLISSQVP